jgi:hypothetical protein
MTTLRISHDALGLISTLLDVHDDDVELAENSGYPLRTIEELRAAVRLALTEGE